MSDKPDKSDDKPNRFNDGMIISIGGTIVADTEAEVYGVPSRVGEDQALPDDTDHSTTDE